MLHDYGYNSERQPYNTIPAILSRISSKCLEKIVLSMYFESEDDLDLPVWARITDILAQPQFASLKHIQIRLEGEVEVVAKQRLAQYFSVLDASVQFVMRSTRGSSLWN
jgi:hypothetical protein